jgi:DNA-directed RNA polymerase subunit RPC12/RpoP
MSETESALTQFLCPLCHRRFPVDRSQHRTESQCAHCGGRVLVLLEGQPTESKPLPASGSKPIAQPATPDDPADSLPGPVNVPLALYVVAGLILVQGITGVVGDVFVDHNIEIFSFAFEVWEITIGWQLFSLRPTALRSARIIVVIQMLFGLLAVAMLLWIYTHSGEGLDERGSHIYLRFGDKDIKSATDAKFLIVIMSLFTLGMIAWEFWVLRRPSVCRVFNEKHRPHIVGAMSMTRFLLLVMLLLSVYLTKILLTMQFLDGTGGSKNPEMGQETHTISQFPEKDRQLQHRQ